MSFILTGAFYGMKAVLSYHHAIQRTNSRLRDTDYMLVVPFVEVASPHLSRCVSFAIITQLVLVHHHSVQK